MCNKTKRNDQELKQNGTNIIKLLLFMFTIFLYLFIICYDEAFFSIFSFPYERAVVPINFYLLNMLVVLFWNFTFFIVFAFEIVLTSFLGIIAVILINVAKRRSITQNFPISSIYNSNKSRILGITVAATCIIMGLAYNYRDIILDRIIEIDYSLHENSELWFYLLLSSYIFICFVTYIKKDYLIEILKSILIVDEIANKSVISLCIKKVPSLFVYLFLLLFFISFIFFNDLLIVKIGTDDAISLVQGKPPRFEGDPGRYEIKLLLNESDLNLSNKSLIFFMLQDGIYYFVEKHPEFGKDHHDNYTSVYAVPSSKVKLASLTLIKSEDNRKSLISGSI